MLEKLLNWYNMRAMYFRNMVIARILFLFRPRWCCLRIICYSVRWCSFVSFGLGERVCFFCIFGHTFRAGIWKREDKAQHIDTAKWMHWYHPFGVRIPCKMIALSGILIGLPPLGHKYSFAPSLAFDKQGMARQRNDDTKKANQHTQRKCRSQQIERNETTTRRFKKKSDRDL